MADWGTLLALPTVGLCGQPQRPSNEEQSLGPSWSWEHLAGRFIELSGERFGATLTGACIVIKDAQAQGEPVVWLTLSRQFYPPDFAASGVDLDALPVVQADGLNKLLRATDCLIRSGSFGLAIVDLARIPQIPLAKQGRLVSLAQKHNTAILCLTQKARHQPSVGSVISLRGQASFHPLKDGRFRCQIDTVKDKRRGPGWKDSYDVCGPAGLY